MFSEENHQFSTCAGTGIPVIGKCDSVIPLSSCNSAQRTKQKTLLKYVHV